MLREQVEGIKEKEPGLLRQRTGGCRFCGQIVTIEAPGGWEEEEIDELATECCGCEEAKSYTFKKKRKERAIEAISKQFGPYKEMGIVKEETIDLLERIVDQVVEDKIKSGTIDIRDGLKAKIGITAKGAIKVERSKTEKESREA